MMFLNIYNIFNLLIKKNFLVLKMLQFRLFLTKLNSSSAFSIKRQFRRKYLGKKKKNYNVKGCMKCEILSTKN